MGAVILDGKRIAAELEEDIRAQVAQIRAAGGLPHLTVVRVGEDPASAVYVKSKVKGCERVGMGSEQIVLDASTSEAEVLDLIRQLNLNPKVHGILVQLPLPSHMQEQRVLETLDPLKDVDGFHPFNVGKLWQGHPTLVSATPFGIMELLRRSGIEVAGMNAVIVGRSNIVGRPMAALLLNAHATVTVCHSRTRDLRAVVRGADLVVAAIGRANFLRADMIRPGAVVVDVGINRNAEGKLVGDVDFEPVSEVAGYLSPVPGGVGPMTIASVISNTLVAYRLQNLKAPVRA